MQFIDYKENNGKYNMDFDLEILNQSIKNAEKEPVIRFYGWTPACVSLGRNQSESKVNIEYCKKKVWNKLIQNAMKQNFSWEESAQKYTS